MILSAAVVEERCGEPKRIVTVQESSALAFITPIVHMVLWRTVARIMFEPITRRIPFASSFASICPHTVGHGKILRPRLHPFEERPPDLSHLSTVESLA